MSKRRVIRLYDICIFVYAACVCVCLERCVEAVFHIFWKSNLLSNLFVSLSLFLGCFYDLTLSYDIAFYFSGGCVLLGGVTLFICTLPCLDATTNSETPLPSLEDVRTEHVPDVADSAQPCTPSTPMVTPVVTSWQTCDTNTPLSRLCFLTVFDDLKFWFVWKSIYFCKVLLWILILYNWSLSFPGVPTFYFKTCNRPKEPVLWVICSKQ